jgi:hypothetical protein
MNLMTSRFSSGDIIRAADISNANLQSWLKRDIITGQGIAGAGSPGKHRSFSWFNLTEIATAAALMHVGLSSPQDAFRAAQQFSHGSDGGTPWGADDALADDEPHRWAGLPFDMALGETYLYVSGTKSAVLLHRDGAMDIAAVRRALDAPLGFVALNLTQLFLDVTHRLGIDGGTTLAAIYSGAD